MSTANRLQNDQAQVNELLDSWVKAVLAQDIERIVSHYTADILAFDAIAQLQFKGKEAYKAHWQACMAMCPGPGVFEIHQPTLEISGDLGLGYYLCHCGGTDANGQAQSSWMRMTQGYHKHNGQWLIAHEHFSMPFDMESGKALFDLKP